MFKTKCHLGATKLLYIAIAKDIDGATSEQEPHHFLTLNPCRLVGNCNQKITRLGASTMPSHCIFNPVYSYVITLWVYSYQEEAVLTCYCIEQFFFYQILWS